MASLRYGFFFATLPKRPASRSRLFTVDVETVFLPVLFKEAASEALALVRILKPMMASTMQATRGTGMSDTSPESKVAAQTRVFKASLFWGTRAGERVGKAKRSAWAWISGRSLHLLQEAWEVKFLQTGGPHWEHLKPDTANQEVFHSILDVRQLLTLRIK